MVTVYTKSNCVQCDQTKRYLDRAGIGYTEEDLLSEKNAAQLAYFKAEGFASAPIVVTDIGTWSGFRLDKLKGL
jgi:glutaredoxin-like protein NrdH